MEPAPPAIGVFDSGIGGLSILREIQAQLPGEDLIYLADQAWVPYGSRPLEQVRERAVTVAGELIRRGAKLVVVACNSASAAALHHLRRVYPEVPFVGMEPAVKPAAEHSDRGVVGVLATAATFQGELYASVLDRHANGVEVHEVAAAELAMLVEDGRFTDAKEALRGLLQPLIAAGIDRLVLGCTHYSFLSDEIRAVMGPEVELVDPSAAVARQVGRVLAAKTQPGRNGQIAYLTTGDPARLGSQLAALFGIDAIVQPVELG